MDRNIAITILAVAAIAVCGFCLVDEGGTDVDAADAGTCGTNLSWSFSDDGTLSITGSGTMSSYSKGKTPWNAYMSQITTVSIGSSVTSISQYAFAGAPITSIVIPNSVESIGAYAFDGCRQLQTISIGTGLASWQDSVFRNCTSVTTIDINAVSASKDFTVTSYNNSSPFQNCGLDASSNVYVRFGSSVQSITPYLFYNVADLGTIALGSNVTSIGSNAFEYTGLTSVSFPQRVTSIGSDAFHGCASLRTLTIPDNVTSIGDSAFEGCTGLVSIDIGSGLTSWSSLVFANCTSVTSVEIDAPSASKDFTITSYNNECPFLNIGRDATSSARVTFGPSVQSITPYLFYGVADLGSVSFGSNVTTIGSNAFERTGLASVAFPSKITTINAEAFYGCESLRTLTIPDNVTTLGDSAFEGCSELMTITIGSGITTWNDSVFQNCSSVTAIQYNPVSASKDFTFTSYNNGAPFSGCGNSIDNLTITIGTNVKSLPNYIFYGTAAKSIVIGPSVESIGSYAFSNSPYVSSITFQVIDQPSIGEGAFSLGLSNNLATCNVLSKYGSGFLSQYSNSYTTFTYGTYYGEMFTVTLVTNCDTSVDPMEIESGYTIPFPELENYGYKSGGWYTDRSFKNLFDPSTPVTKDITLYHQWIEKLKYNIQFVMNCSETMDPIVLFEDDVIASSITGIPSREDYNFAGWYLDAELTIPLDPQALPTEDMTLYASWEEKPLMSGTTLTIIAVVVCFVLSILAVMFVRR